MPDNAGYYHAAYVVAAVILGAYTASIWWRARRLRERGGRGGGDAAGR